METKITFDLRDKGLFINGKQLPYPLYRTELAKHLGEPLIQSMGGGDWRAIWDDLGIYASSCPEVFEICIIINPISVDKPLPKKLFKGNILINGKPIEEFSEDYITVNRYLITTLWNSGVGNNPIYGYGILKNYDYIDDPDKYKFKKIDGDKIEFADFNFKLAVIEELMYSKKHLKPRFDLQEFITIYDKRKIDIEKEGNEPISEVVEYFEKLEIDQKLAKYITKIEQDGGNEIYLQIVPHSSGYEDIFNIRSFEDVKHFPNLKKMTLLYDEAYEKDKVFEELKAKGIKAKYV